MKSLNPVRRTEATQTLENQILCRQFLFPSRRRLPSSSRGARTPGECARSGTLDRQYRGEILFATRKARIILQTLFPQTSDSVIPNEIRAWLIEGDTSKPFAVRHPEKGEIEIHHFSFSHAGSLSLMRLEKRPVDHGPKALMALGLTAREAEVLYWITEGKTNPEIAIILEASPETVKKHAANLYAKLGVPTRTSAARCALSVLQPNALSIQSPDDRSSRREILLDSARF